MITNIYLVIGHDGGTWDDDTQHDVVAANTQDDARTQAAALFKMEKRYVKAFLRFSDVDLNPIRRWPSGCGIPDQITEAKTI